MKQKKLIFNFFVNRNWKKVTDSRKRAKILADNRKYNHPIETLDVVMLLGEDRCGSLKGERGLIREVTLGKEGWLINQVGPPVPRDLYSSQESHPSWFPLVR